MRVNATIKVAFFIDSHCFECMTHKMVSRYMVDDCKNTSKLVQYFFYW